MLSQSVVHAENDVGVLQGLTGEHFELVRSRSLAGQVEAVLQSCLGLGLQRRTGSAPNMAEKSIGKQHLIILSSQYRP